ncbi:FtsX-like permease family protein [Phytohabitans flavus]|uniref:FtsX-like permease family protein n=1 Tax=Phytohabitans flavus TaxID=1076124 RepID=UPI003630BF88
MWHGSVVGDLFGVPVSLQDRWIDTAATALIVLAAAFVVGDVGLLAVRDRRAELADLRVQGLLRTQVAGLVVREIAILVLLGAALGGTAGATLAAVIDGALPG